jgi:stage III sporulation protein AH
MSNLRKQTAVIAVLIVLIACAGWFAKRFNDRVQDTSALNSKSSKATSNANFFAESRMGRDNSRSVIKQELEAVINNKSAAKEAKNVASTQLMQLIDRGDKENKIETLVKSKGFEDALCFIDEHGVELTVKSEEPLTAEKVSQIKDIIVKTTKMSPSVITVRQQQ